MSLRYLVSIHGRHDQRVRAEKGPHHLGHLDELAEGVPPVPLGEGESPHDLGEEGQESRQDVCDAQVQDEEVHSGHLRASEAAAVREKQERSLIHCPCFSSLLEQPVGYN